MDQGEPLSGGWRALAEAAPGIIGIQTSGEFVYVADELATAFGAETDALTGVPLRTLFGSREARRLEREALPRVRADSEWTGDVRIGDGDPDTTGIAVTLSPIESDAVLWTMVDADTQGTAGDEADSRSRNRVLAGAISCDTEADEVVCRGSAYAEEETDMHGFGGSEDLLEIVDDGVYAIDEELRFTYVNDALCELLEWTREDLLGTSAMGLFQDDTEASTATAVRERVVAAAEDHGTLKATLSTSEGERELESRFHLHPEADGEFRGTVGVVRDVTEREERTRSLRHQCDELATLDSINELLLETARELVERPDRDAVEQTVCERLAASDLYQFAWVGERDLESERVVPRTSAGAVDGYLDAVTITDGDGPTGRGPVGRAMRSGEVEVVSVDDPSFVYWREPAVARGIKSVAVVPLRHRSTIYGILAVYASRDDAFSEREQAGFDVLGRTVGLAIYAANHRELLFAETAVELAFRVRGADSILARTAADLGCALELDGYVASDLHWVLYLAVDGTAPESVAEALRGADRVERARMVGGDDQARVEVVHSSSPLLQTVTTTGAAVATATIGPDDARLVIEAPAEADLHAIADRLRADSAEVDLLSRRERDRAVETPGRPDGLLDDLTDRQQEALETAYHAGYFSWPRESTAETVAASLDLAPATLHAHLRKSQETILETLLGRE